MGGRGGDVILLCRGFTQVAKGNPCRNLYMNACVYVYIYICVNKHRGLSGCRY